MRLGLQRALPSEVADAAAGETCVRRFLERLGDDVALRELEESLEGLIEVKLYYLANK